MNQALKQPAGSDSWVRRYSVAVLSPLAIAAVVCGVLWFTLSGPPSLPFLQGPPLLSVDPSPSATFQARDGETVTAEFTVKNITDEPVRLLGANTSCGCTVVTTEFPMELAPGESATLLANMEVGEPNADGKYIQQANLLVNRAGTVPALVIEAVVSDS